MAQSETQGMDARRSALPRFARKPWIFIGAAVLIAIVAWAYSTRTQKHEVKAVFTDAPSVYTGLDVRVDGIDAGKVTSVKHEDGRAVIGIGVDDDDVWPLHRGATATLRFGTTIGNGTRQIELDPGPKNAPEIPDGGIIENKDTVEATEFDDVFDTFDRKTRKGLQGAMAGTGDAFGPRAKEISDAVDKGGPGFDAVADLADQLASDTPALRKLVADTDVVTAELGPRSERIKGFVVNGAGTFNAFAQNTQGITGSLDQFPDALRQTRTTLDRLDTSVGHLDSLMADIRPGARKLAPLARDLRPAFAELRSTVPSAVATFRTARRAAPPVTAMLKQTGPFASRAAPTLKRLAPQLACIRPYAPEIAGLMSTWTSFTKNYDGVPGTHTGRIWGNFGPTSLTETPKGTSIPAFMAATGQQYALVRPPGFNAKQPWLQPECNQGARGLDATQDQDGSQ